MTSSPSSAAGTWLRRRSGRRGEPCRRRRRPIILLGGLTWDELGEYAPWRVLRDDRPEAVRHVPPTSLVRGRRQPADPPHRYLTGPQRLANGDPAIWVSLRATRDH